jgi:hypothetical protein
VGGAGAGGSAGASSLACPGNVTIPDANLLAAIRAALGIPTGPISGAQAATLTDLYAPGASIGDLTGLECFTGLVNVTLNNNQITHVYQLEGLPNLRTLDISVNQVRDLYYMPALTTLDASNNQLADTDFWDMPSLMTMDVSYNFICDMYGFQFLTSLDSLDLRWNPAHHLDALIDNPGFGPGDVLYLDSTFGLCGAGARCIVKCGWLAQDVEALESIGVTVVDPPLCEQRCPPGP